MRSSACTAGLSNWSGTTRPEHGTPRDDDGSRVERLYNAVNGARLGEHWG